MSITRNFFFFLFFLTTEAIELSEFSGVPIQEHVFMVAPARRLGSRCRRLTSNVEAL